MKKDVKYPIILEKPTTRVVIEFLLKKFGIRLERTDQVFLCQKETCEIDKDVSVSISENNPRSENFVCLFFIDKKDGFVPIVPPQKIKEFVDQKTWGGSEETLSDVMRTLDVRPDFVITFGRLDMPSGISNTCWCVHEFLEVNEGKNTGFFGPLTDVPAIVKMFTDYLWNNLPILNASIKESEEGQSKPKFQTRKEATVTEAEPEIEEVFKMEDIIIQVLNEIPLEKQKRLLMCFCEKKKEFNEHLPEISSWDEKHIKTFILKNDVLNDFDEHREKIAAAMTSMMSNEGIVEPTD